MLKNTIKLEKIKSLEDIEQCVQMYLSINDQSFLPASADVSIQNMVMRVRRGRYVRVVRKHDEIVAWIYADLVQLEHTDYSCFQQLYYASSAKGFAAARYLRLLHSDMVNQARTTNARYCVSISSHMDETFVLARLLEKDGWQRRGHVAIFDLQTAPARTQVVAGCDPRLQLGVPSGRHDAVPPAGR